MAKKNKNRKILIGIIIAVLAIFSVFMIYHFGFSNKPLATTSGYTSLSISNVEIVDQGARIRIYGVANGAEQIQIYFTPNDINEYINEDGYSATKSVTGSITLVNPTREFYATKDTSKNFYKLTWKSVGILSGCENNAPSGTITIGKIATTTCLYYNSLGTYSTFSGQYVDSTPVNVDIGGSTGTLNPSSGNNVLVLNDGKTKIEWVGNLVNFQGINTPNYALLFSGSQYNKLIDVGSYNSQETAYNTLSDCIGASRNSLSQLGLLGTFINLFRSDSASRDCVDSFNNKVTTYMVDKKSNYVSSVNIEGATFTTNGLKLDLTTPTSFPTFIITLDATKVGIIELKGTPDIVSCVADTTISSGDTYATNVKVKNVGTNDGSFYGQVTCSGSSGVSGVTSEQYVGAGQTVTMPVQVSGENTQSGTSYNYCSIKIIDRKSQSYDTCSFKVGVTYQPNMVCSPNAVTCKDSDNLKICNSDGTSYTTTNCPNGCTVLDSGEAKCKGASGENDTNTRCADCEAYAKSLIFGKIFKSQDCQKKLFQNTLFCIGAILKMFAVPLFFILALVFGIQFFNQILKGKYKALAWILTIAVASLIAYLTYIIFYVGLIVFIVYIAIRIAINFIPGLNVARKFT